MHTQSHTCTHSCTRVHCHMCAHKHTLQNVTIPRKQILLSEPPRPPCPPTFPPPSHADLWPSRRFPAEREEAQTPRVSSWISLPCQKSSGLGQMRPFSTGTEFSQPPAQVSPGCPSGGGRPFKESVPEPRAGNGHTSLGDSATSPAHPAAASCPPGRGAPGQAGSKAAGWARGPPVSQSARGPGAPLCQPRLDTGHADGQAGAALTSRAAVLSAVLPASGCPLGWKS